MRDKERAGREKREWARGRREKEKKKKMILVVAE